MTLHAICNTLLKGVPGKEKTVNIISKEFLLITEFAIVSMLTAKIF